MGICQILVDLLKLLLLICFRIIGANNVQACQILTCYLIDIIRQTL